MKDLSHYDHDLPKYFHIKNAKFLAFTLISLFVMYHGFLNSFYGRHSCNRLLGEGHIFGDNEWQPFGCMMHKYKRNDIENCFKYTKFYNGLNYFIFIGDSRIQQLYYSFISQFDLSSKFNQFLNQSHNYSNQNLNLIVNFIWSPIIDESLNSFIENLIETPVKPLFVIFGLGTNYIESNRSNDAFEWYKSNLTTIVDTLQSNKNAKNLNLYWMLQDPIDEVKYLQIYNSTRLTNRQIDYFNRETINLLYHSPITLWSSNRLVSQGYNRHHSDQRSSDGLHLSSYVLEIDAQMLVNLYCNNKMMFNDGSCCSQPETMSLLQKILFSFFFLCCFMSIYLFVYRTYCKNSKLRVNISGSEITLNGGTCKDATSSIGFQTMINSLSKLALIMLYFYLCDRANFFMKENKHYTTLSFLIPLIYVSVLGFFFHESTSITHVLNRQQTNEFKGFMQIVILIYGISGAEKNLVFYILIRMFTSSYLFISGYGHFLFYWNTANYSLARFFAILFRLNFLPILLCFTMNRMYQFYSFIPFVTFSYVCLYILMILPPRIGSRTSDEKIIDYLFMLIKLLVFGGFIATLNMSEVLFENVFIRRPWKFLFISSDDLIHEWKSTWNHDCYTVLYGMSFAFVLVILKKMTIIRDEEQMLFKSKRLNFLIILVTLTGLVSYIIFVSMCGSKEEYDQVHVFLIPLPIVSFILLRNISWFFREKCSHLLIWFGKLSLELYISSFHIFQAADSNGVLVLIPGYPVLNILIVTFIFICIAYELHSITRVLSKCLVPVNNVKIILRNLCIFLLLLMPIAIKYGYI